MGFDCISSGAPFISYEPIDKKNEVGGTISRTYLIRLERMLVTSIECFRFWMNLCGASKFKSPVIPTLIKNFSLGLPNYLLIMSL